MKPLKIISCFDGISCGQQALKEMNIPIKEYLSSEIHIPSINITQKHFPKTTQLGDIKYVKWQKHFGKPDLVWGGSPCQGFSFLGKRLNLDDPRSKLFFEFYRLLKESNPKYFLLENVLMDKKSESTITKLLKVVPKMLNSSYFSAQIRKRLYWTNIPLTKLPKENLDTLSSILMQPNKNDPCWKIPWGELRELEKKLMLKRLYHNKKTPCLLARSISRDNRIFLVDRGSYRLLTPIEYERLQGLPDNYTYGILNSKRYTVIGNGWQVDTIKYILGGLY